MIIINYTSSTHLGIFLVDDPDGGSLRPDDELVEPGLDLQVPTDDAIGLWSKLTTR